MGLDLYLHVFAHKVETITKYVPETSAWQTVRNDKGWEEKSIFQVNFLKDILQPYVKDNCSDNDEEVIKNKLNVFNIEGEECEITYRVMTMESISKIKKSVERLLEDAKCNMDTNEKLSNGEVSKLDVAALKEKIFDDEAIKTLQNVTDDSVTKVLENIFKERMETAREAFLEYQEAYENLQLILKDLEGLEFLLSAFYESFTLEDNMSYDKFKFLLELNY